MSISKSLPSSQILIIIHICLHVCHSSGLSFSVSEVLVRKGIISEFWRTTVLECLRIFYRTWKLVNQPRYIHQLILPSRWNKKIIFP